MSCQQPSAPPEQVSNLSRHLDALRGTALMINIVIGAGLLTLPGLGVKVAGAHAFLAWIFCAMTSIPLLGVFVILGRKMPKAGGITTYSQEAFGPFGQLVAAWLFLGAVVFGLPSIALTGGHYAVQIIGGNAAFYAMALVVLSLVPHFLPGPGVAKAMSWIASTVLTAIILFLCIGLFGLLKTGGGTGNLPTFPPDITVTMLLAPFMMIFFAFTGWEVGAGSAEEYENPKRDFPIAMIGSFIIVTTLYLALAFVVQRTDVSSAYEAPFSIIVWPVLGEFGGYLVAMTATLIVFANLSGAIWGVSRLVFSLAREGVLPAPLAITREGRPIIAVVVTASCLLGVLMAETIWHFGLETMIARAGMNFLILYGLSAAALVVLSSSWAIKVYGWVVILLVGGIIVWSGMSIGYPLALIVMAGAFHIATRILSKRTA